MQLSACTVVRSGSVPSKKHSSKIFKSQKHRVQVTFDLCTELGYTWVIAITAFFLIPGYFSTHLVIFTPWCYKIQKNIIKIKKLTDDLVN
jgi:predicted methyltransferase